MRQRTAHFRGISLTSVPGIKVAHVTIEQLGAQGRIIVRGHRQRKAYALPLAEVASIIVWRVAKRLVAERQAEKRRLRKQRREERAQASKSVCIRRVFIG